MHRAIRSGLIAVASIVGGVIVWFGSAWALSIIADRTSSQVAERALAAISPLAFGPVVPVVVGVVIYILVARRAHPR